MMRKTGIVLLTAAMMTAGAFGAKADEGEAALRVVGEDTTGGGYGFIVTNRTGKEITGMTIRVNYGEYGEDLLSDSEALEDGGQVQLYCTPGEMVNYVPAVYDLSLAFADGGEAVLHTLPMGDAKEIEVLTERAGADAGETGATENAEDSDSAEADAEDAAEAAVTYIRFTSQSLGYEVDTLRRESEIAQIGEAVLKADYDAKVANAGSSYSGGYYSDDSSGGGSYSGGSDGGNGGGSGGNEGGDGCLTDGILF